MQRRAEKHALVVGVRGDDEHMLPRKHSHRRTIQEHTTEKGFYEKTHYDQHGAEAQRTAHGAPEEVHGGGAYPSVRHGGDSYCTWRLDCERVP